MALALESILVQESDVQDHFGVILNFKKGPIGALMESRLILVCAQMGCQITFEFRNIAKLFRSSLKDDNKIVFDALVKAGKISGL